jgi:omega-amidase
MKDFLIALAQWPVVLDKKENLDRAEAMIIEAGRKGAQLCVLPESFQVPYELSLLREQAETEDGPTLTRLRKVTAESRIHLVAGSFSERRGASFHNSSFVIGPYGEVLGVHRKIHLFDVNLDTLAIQESSLFTPGERPLVVDLPFCRLGVAVCYDLRFPAVFRFFEKAGVEVAALPAAFSTETGKAHWHLLLRSRAVEYQIFVAGACPAPNRATPYVAYGHSSIITPWGEVLRDAAEESTLLCAELHARLLADVRKKLPALRHRREDLYAKWG